MIKRCFLLTVIMLVVLATGGSAMAHSEMSGGQYFTLIDENSNVIHLTGMMVNKGDEYISADNSRYRVVDITGHTARCVYQGKEKMPVISDSNQSNALGYSGTRLAPVAANKKATVAIYHTHSDESYVPGDGTESVNGKGGIYDVGQALSKRLQKLGFNVEYNHNNHNPHDVNAYSRSRKTAASLLKQSPDVILDVHRDAVPAEQYNTEVKGTEATKVKLVVGNQNPNMKTNLEFAKRIKAAMDKKTPGLSNGIFIGKGDYNQDLSPRAMLIEVGAHTNKKSDATEGVMLFADTLPAVLGINTVNANNATPAAKPLSTQNQGAGTTILIILVVVATAAGGFYLLNRGSTGK
ncbi:MAG: stage II sporulation protein P [Syntrophomonadaceae bacterium]|nr:stage II sporulation protein P [Syntrophomonadaceae bacterium]MDD3271132.1 stage II sporulation protein P [Syntrophomonadaceae bacterium]MDD3898448.1 stage II sporulation protein P [Syntrophomonadaceae bacterium]MDD4562663.1 stage II sporulation protein P [Syntrophomonadaceae bacterium]